MVVAKLYGLYDHDEELTNHSTADEFVGVFHLVTIGAWLLFAGAWLTRLWSPDLGELVFFWGAGIAFVTAGRALGRGVCRQAVAYLQTQKARRTKLQAQVLTLQKQREAFLRAQSGGRADAFDEQVVQNLREKAAQEGMKY